MTNPRTWPWILTFGAALTLAACKDKTPPAATAAPDAATTEPDAAAAPAVHAVVYQAEDRVDIKRGGGKWYPGVVVAKAGDGYRVHFDGTAKEFDETVTVDRLRPAAVAVAPKPEVTDAAPRARVRPRRRRRPKPSPNPSPRRRSSSPSARALETIARRNKSA